MGKKILIVSQYFYPENFRINDIALSLSERGHRVEVLTGRPNYPQGIIYDGYSDSHKRVEDYQGLKIHRLKNRPRGQSKISLGMNYLSFMIRGWFWVKRHKRKYDLIFGFEVSPITSILPAVWLAKKQNTKCILYLQDIWPEALMMGGIKETSWVLKPILKMVKYIYRQHPTILVPSKAYIPWIKKQNTDVEVIYWPQYPETFYHPVSKDDSILFKEVKFRLMFTGNMGTSQGLEQMLEVIGQLKPKLNENDFEFVLIGEGRAKKDLISQSKSLNIESLVQFMDAVPATEVPRYLAHAKMAYLSFSKNKLFEAVIPAKLQSYMACGIPILGWVDGVSAQIIEEARGGKVVSLNTNMANTLIELIKTPKNTLIMWGQNNLTYVNQHFNKESLLNTFEKQFLSEATNV
jgi:glycosyltransferase involved in cell wall biosynthesis